VAGGNYSGDLTPAKSCSAANTLAIRRARGDSVECTGAAGWNASYDSTVRQVQAGIGFDSNSSYVIISGRTTASGGNHGWLIDYTGLTGGAGIYYGHQRTNTYSTIEYMDLQGPGNITYSSDGRAIDNTPYQGDSSGATFSHLKIWGWESGAYQVYSGNAIYDHIEMFDIGAANWADYHPNGIYTSGANDVTVRYSKFHKGPNGNGCGEGIFFEQSGGSSNWKIYGNVFYDLDYSGLKALNIASLAANIKIFNNTFDNILIPLYKTEAGCTSGAETRNNLFYASSPENCGTMTNNLVISSSPNPFVNRGTHDYHIVSTTGTNYPRNAGAALTQDGYINYDIDGKQRGADGAWDIGAYEYGSSDTSSPAGVRGVRIAQ
jgi:hypothetical protein